MEGRNRECVIQYETPIIIPRGSNPNNPLAKDVPVKRNDSLFDDILSTLVVLGFLLFFFYAFITTVKNWDRDEKLIAEFEKGSTLWCRPGYELTSEIRINNGEGWEYIAHREMFVNEKLGVTAKFSTNLCR